MTPPSPSAPQTRSGGGAPASPSPTSTAAEGADSAAAPALRTRRRGPWLQLGRTRGFGVSEVTLPLGGLPAELSGLRLLHLGDTHFHEGLWEEGFDAALDLIANELRPDLVCHTGDWIDDKFDPRPGLPIVKRFVERLLPAARLGVWSCMGNHDGDLLAPHLIDLGVRVLLGETARFVGGSGALELVGLPSVSRDDLTERVVSDIAPKPPATVRVMLCHFPDAIGKVASLAPDLFLAGHTHGGQVCLPGGRPLTTHDRLPKRMAAGLHRVGDTWLHVTRGLGWTGLPLRAFCPAEMTVIELVGADSP